MPAQIDTPQDGVAFAKDRRGRRPEPRASKRQKALRKAGGARTRGVGGEGGRVQQSSNEEQILSNACWSR